MSISEIQSYISAIENDSSLCDEKIFENRIEAIDFIEFQISDQIEALLPKATQTDKLPSLKHRAEKVKAKLQEIDSNLFQKLRADIRAGGYTGKEFKNLVSEYVNIDNVRNQGEPGYDNLDVFINGLCQHKSIPEQTMDLEPEMVYYQKTPARIVFELVEKCNFKRDDIFVDLGSGLGQVAILVNLLTGIQTTGIEFEPAFCDYARDCAAELNLPNVAFINADARKTGYSDGTVFFMFTPFRGEIMKEVLELLRKESLSRKIKIITYGPCTVEVALQDWLDFEDSKDDTIYRLGIFSSF